MLQNWCNAATMLLQCCYNAAAAATNHELNAIHLIALPFPHHSATKVPRRQGQRGLGRRLSVPPRLGGPRPVTPWRLLTRRF